MPIFNFKKDSTTTPETSNVESMDSKPVPQAEAQAEPVVEEVPTQEESTTSETPFQTPTHLISYPLVKETVDFVDGLPGVRSVKATTASYVDPAFKLFANQSFIRPVIRTVDGLSDQALSTVESVTPCIKTATYGCISSSVKEPFNQAGGVITSTKVSCDDAIEQNVVTPSVKFVHDVRAYYNEHLYDTKGKPLLRSTLDPVFRPINKSIEEFSQKKLPQVEPITTASKEYSSEIEKNVHLSVDLAYRSIPVIGEKITETAMIPCNYFKHVVDVFNDNLMKQEERDIVTGSVVATYNSSKDLAGEAWTETVSSFNKTFGIKQSETTANITKETPGTGSDTETAVEAIIAA